MTTVKGKIEQILKPVEPSSRNGAEEVLLLNDKVNREIEDDSVNIHLTISKVDTDIRGVEAMERSNIAEESETEWGPRSYYEVCTSEMFANDTVSN